ncbi:MAG TPA: tRNA (adenosine(37)-N6)-threonylcarbamoyltransferase complex ATPase subunit type 1 TsaE [Candidatus Limnocylindrales bacterium]|nr:tRNA (adenosine(37)-N6)-threonylcarbamoyltransferase complex ATPase subunit type 1 TsaE [Candidatus Limnocylindrales bacterium]
MDTSISVETGSVEETRALGRCLGQAVAPGDLIALEGELGTGKTVLVQGIAQALGVRDGVHSPTFVLHHRYRGPVPLDHYDLYRLEGLGWADAGLDEPAPDAVSVVEWSERAAPLERWADVRIRLDAIDEQRRRLTCIKGSDAVRACFHGQPSRA